jgi:hypothetical protein
LRGSGPLNAAVPLDVSEEARTVLEALARATNVTEEHTMTMEGGEWGKRDELAAMFMQAIIPGRLAHGIDPVGEGKSNASKAYALADAFLTVRREQATAGRSGSPGGKK